MENDSKYRKLIDEYADIIYKIALSYLRNRDDAEDIVQEVFMKYMSNKKPFKDNTHKKNWLIKVAINLCYNEIHKRKMVSRKIIDKTNCFEFMTEQENTIYSYLNKLDDKYKIVFELYYFHDYKTKAISNILRITEVAVRTRLKRARRMLKKYIEEGELF